MTRVEVKEEAVEEILRRYRPEPAPFLSILHAVQELYGCIPEPALIQLSRALEIPRSELFGTISFYHYFRFSPPESTNVRHLCGGPACALKGDDHLGNDAVSCPGRCDTPIARMVGDLFEPMETAVPPETGKPECLFENIRRGRKEHYDTLAKVKDDPEGSIDTLKKSGLVGRGGAGFPTGVKWEAVRNAPGDEKYIVCNADEGEPGCFKDRVLMNLDPHAMLEGMAAAGLICGSKIGIVYLRYEYPETIGILRKAIAESNMGDFKVFVRRGAGAYICGEETSLLNSLEGLRPFPRDKPPYPTTHGLFQKPTVINNVETFAAVPQILRNGADWYQGLGEGEHAGTKIFSVSGDVDRPGNYELPLGTPLPDLLQMAGARKTKAVTMAGISGGFLGGDDLNVTLDIPSVKKAGSMLGAGGIIVYDESRCMVRAAKDCMKFFAYESCGKCFPCRIGTTRATEVLDNPKDGAESDLQELGRVMGTMSACGLGLAAPMVTDSLMKYWPEEIKAHRDGECR